MKKLISLIALLGVAISSYAVSYTFIIPTATMTNLNSIGAPNSGGPVRLLSAVLAAPVNAAATCKLIDCGTNDLTLAVGAYTNWLTSATNVISSWTNYYGVVNWSTNIGIVKLSNYVAASTFTYPTRMGLSAATNTTAYVDQINSWFFQGVGITNNSPGTISVTLNYQQ